MRVLICGGRDYQDKVTMYNVLNEFLDDINTPVTIISGGAKGADTLAEEFSMYFDLPFEKYPADWDKHGRAAGYIRNKRMLDEGKPDLVVAFPGGKGTAMMVKLAREAGVEVREVT